MSPRNVTVIVLAWNRWELTRRCLETVRRHTSETPGPYDVTRNTALTP